MSYGCNLALITFTITLPLIRLSIRAGEDERCSQTDCIGIILNSGLVTNALIQDELVLHKTTS